MADEIAARLPAHGHYVEPFAGSLAVLLAKNPADMETVNDIDGDLMNFWRVLREQPDEFIRACALTPHSRAEYVLSFDRGPYLSDLERARRTWICITQGRGATLLSSGWRHYVKPRGSTGMPDYLDAYVTRMGAAVERLRHVSLECQPALQLVRRYGAHRDVLLYVDPPYLAATRAGGTSKRYANEMMAEAEHTELLGALLDCKSSVMLSGYPSELYDTALGDWHRIEFKAGTGQSARGEWSTRTEVIWANRPIEEAATLPYA